MLLGKVCILSTGWNYSNLLDAPGVFFLYIRNSTETGEA
jgi:hypothetical protein